MKNHKRPAREPTMPRWRHLRRWPWIVALCLIAAGLFQLWSTASRLDTASGVLRVAARDATLGWIGLGHENIGDASGSRQADFWLSETARILPDNQTSEMARGAAWMLDSAANNFYGRSWSALPHPSMVNGGIFASSRDANDFEAKAGPKCTELTELATRLAPGQVDAWRTRGLLWFRSPWFFKPAEPRDPQWLTALDQAVRNDPDNGLYDYAAANFQWLRSSQPGHRDDHISLVINDPQQFADGTLHFERAQQKPYVRGGDSDWKAIAKFLELSSVPKHEHPHLLASRLLEYEEGRLVYDLPSLLSRRQRDESPEEQFQALNQSLRVGEQLGTVEAGPGGINLGNMLTYQWIAVVRDHPEFAGVLAASARKRLLMLRAHELLTQEAARELPQPGSPTTLSFLECLSSLVAASALSLSALLGAIAVGCWVLSRRLSNDNAGRTWRLAALRHLVCWSIAFAFSFTLFGLAPAEFISVDTQQLLARLTIALVPVVGLGGILLLILRYSKSRYVPLALLITVPLIGALLPLVRDPFVGAMAKARSIPELPVSAMAPGVREAAIVILVTEPTDRSTDWAILHWFAYPGPTFTIVTALLLTVGWYWHWSGRPKRDPPTLSRRARLRGTAAEARRSASCAAVLALLVSLALAPTALRNLQTDYDSHMAWFLNIQDRRETLAARVKELESDAQKWQEYREWAEQQVSAEQQQAR